jgi:hypothetical protein
MTSLNNFGQGVLEGVSLITKIVTTTMDWTLHAVNSHLSIKQGRKQTATHSTKADKK